MNLNRFGQESMRGMRDGTQTAGPALFLQFESDYGNGEILEVLGSCVSLVGMS